MLRMTFARTSLLSMRLSLLRNLTTSLKLLKDSRTHQWRLARPSTANRMRALDLVSNKKSNRTLRRRRKSLKKRRKRRKKRRSEELTLFLLGDKN